MASSEGIRRKRLDTLPADFTDWDDSEPPSTLPPDFREFDPSPESEKQEPVVVKPLPAPVAEVIKPTAKAASHPAPRESASRSKSRLQPVVESEIEEEQSEEHSKSHKGILIGSVAAVVVVASAATLFVVKHSSSKAPADAQTTAPAQTISETQGTTDTEKPSASKSATQDTAAPAQAAAPAETAAQPSRTVDASGMQRQLSAPARISSDMKKPGQNEAAPAAGFNGSGFESMGTGNPGIFSGRSGPQVKAEIPSRVNVSASQAMGLVSHKVDPEYPAIAKNFRAGGTVKVQILVGKDGSVQQIGAVDGPRLLQQAAADAVKHWRFRPYTVNNQPVEMTTSVSIAFKLQ